MKWWSLNTFEQKCIRLSNWHLWFAWYPVEVERLPDGACVMVWLKTLKRKGTRWHLWQDSGWTWEFKEQ